MKGRLLLPLVLAGAAAAAFWPALENGFCPLDDEEAFLANPMMQRLGVAELAWMGTTLHLSTYYPLGRLAHAGLLSAFGARPAAFHLASVLLHAVNAALLLGLCRRYLELRGLPRAGPAAFAAAALWALHPLQAAPVAWAVKIPDLMAGGFFLLALHAYLGASPRPRAAMAAAGLFLLSGLSHWNAVALLAAVVLFDIVPLARLPPRPWSWFERPRRRVWTEKTPLLIIAAALILANAAGKSQVQGIRLLHGLTAPGDAACGLFAYASQVPRPWPPAPVYPLVSGGSWAALVGLFAVIAALAAFRRRWPAGLGGALFAVASYLPTFAASSDGVIYGQDVYAYLPGMAAALAVAELLAGLAPRLWVGAGLLAAALAAGEARLVRERLAVWRDGLTLWSAAAQGHPKFWMARFNLGVELVRRGELDGARPHLEAAVDLRSGDPAWTAEVRRALSEMPTGTPRGAETAPYTQK